MNYGGAISIEIEWLVVSAGREGLKARHNPAQRIALGNGYIIPHRALKGQHIENEYVALSGLGESYDPVRGALPSRGRKIVFP
jgi:hypothetical protein